MKNVEDKLDKINCKLDDVIKVQIEQAADLKHHIYRTDLNEKHLKMLEDELKPVKAHVNLVNGVLRGIGGLAVLGSIVKAAIELISFFS